MTALVCVISGFAINEFAERARTERLNESLEQQIERFFSTPRLTSVLAGERIFRQQNEPNQGAWLNVQIPTKVIVSLPGSRTNIIFETEGFPDISIPKKTGFFEAHDGITTWRAKAVMVRRPVDGMAKPIAETVTVVVAISDDRITAASSDLRKLLARVGLFTTVLSAVIGWILGGRVLRPLKRLRTETDLVRVTDDLSKRVDTGGPTEITALAKDINAMLARLESAAFDTALALSSSREFGSNVAHELRTPLTSMRLNLDLLRGPNLEPNDQAPILEQMLQQQDRLLRTLDALRLLSRGDLTQGESSFEEVDLIDVISQAIQREFSGDKNANLSLDLSNEIPLMLGWREGLDVIFRNIFENITAHAVRPDQKLAVNVTARLMPGEVCISIEDNGPGIVSTERARVLERFYQVTGGNSQGSGLGLSLVDQQMVIHGGKVVIGKGDLGGALVTLTFPIEKNNQS